MNTGEFEARKPPAASINEHERIVRVYRRRAGRYDTTSRFFYDLLGMRINRHRRRAVELLRLKGGDTVVELGCGTGANFGLLQEEIGPLGQIIGVDLTPAMLAEAGARVRANGWRNVKMIESPMEAYRFPNSVDAVLSTFALTMVPEYDRVIRGGRDALKVGGRWVVMCFRLPSNWLRRYPRILASLVKPYGGTLAMADRHPWESLQLHLADVTVESFWFDMAYIAAGTRPALENGS